MTTPVHVIGGGLAGSEAAWQAARAGVRVVLHEMRPGGRPRRTRPAPLAELVCSNSFRSDDAAQQRGRPAARGDAPLRLADHGGGRRRTSCRRAARSRSIARASRPRSRPAIAAEPLDRDPARGGRSPAGRRGGRGDRRHRPPHLARARRARSARSPARTRSPSSTPSRRSSIARRIDFEIAWFQSRYDKPGPGGGGADYVNCPLDRGRSTRPSSRRCSPARSTPSRTGRRRRPISRAACRSR